MAKGVGQASFSVDIPYLNYSFPYLPTLLFGLQHHRLNQSIEV